MQKRKLYWSQTHCHKEICFSILTRSNKYLLIEFKAVIFIFLFFELIVGNNFTYETRAHIDKILGCELA